MYITSKEEKNRSNFGEVIIYNVVFNPFSLLIKTTNFSW